MLLSRLRSLAASPRVLAGMCGTATVCVVVAARYSSGKPIMKPLKQLFLVHSLLHVHPAVSIAWRQFQETQPSLPFLRTSLYKCKYGETHAEINS